jgi:hypothetical protein
VYHWMVRSWTQKAPNLDPLAVHRRREVVPGAVAAVPLRVLLALLVLLALPVERKSESEQPVYWNQEV